MSVFITFEGCEGCGKSTQSRLLKEYFEKSGQPFFYAREPGGTEISEKIRSIILDKDNGLMVDECEALLYAAARCQLIKEKILPSLDRGEIVILDRYIHSSFAYQAYARGLGYDFVASVNKFALDNCMPTVTVFMDVPPETAFARKGGVDGADRIELAGLEFHRKVYEGYLALKEKFPDTFVSFKADGNKYQTHEKIVEYLKQNNYIK